MNMKSSNKKHQHSRLVPIKKWNEVKIFENYQPSISEPLQQVSPQSTEQPQDISLDQKVDAMLMDYEREASLLGRELTSPLNDPSVSSGLGLYELFSSSLKKLNKIIYEAPQDDPLAGGLGGSGEAGNLSGGDLGMGDLGGTDEAPGESDNNGSGLTDIPSPKIDINAFASLIARLIMNYDTLLNPKKTILNRTQAYIAKNYNDTVARELMSKLELQYGMSTRNEDERNSDFGETPIANGAAADGPGGA